MKIEYYEGRDDQWYWRLKASNGRTIADGAEGYSNKSNCLRAINRFIDLMMLLQYHIETIEVDC